MRCGKAHPRTYDIPAGATIVDPYLYGWVMVDGQHLRCTIEGCKRAMRTVTIAYTDNGRPCGATCRDAVGMQCKCSCGGRNHGKEAEA